MDENDRKQIEQEEELAWKIHENRVKNEACPNCLSLNLIREGRCITCMECGWSKCEI